MKTNILLFLLMILSSMAFSQGGEFRILPEGGLSLPTKDFKSKYTFGSKGILGGLNLDYFKGKFGIGLYGGINSNGTHYTDDLPPVGGLITSKFSRITKDKWKQLLVGLGPTYRQRISEKFNLEFSLKVGFSKFTFPEYAESIETGAPLNQRYLMYETMNQDVKKGFDFAAIPGMRLSFKPSEKVAISLGANYTSAMGVEHSYTFLDGDFNPEMSDEQLETVLRNAPTNHEVWKCDFNTIGITLGVGFTFGGKDKPKDDQKEDESLEPPIPQYPSDGSTITLQEADSLVLEWVKETPNVERANYNLWLYEVRDSTGNHDSLIYKTKVERSLKHLLPDNIKLWPDSTYRYMVQAIDDPQLKPCPDDCNSVDATFTISTILQTQYYQLLTQDIGNYVENKGTLRFLLPKQIELGGVVQARIINQRSEDVFKIELLTLNSKGEMYSVDDHRRVTINISSLEDGYYLLEVTNENKKDYYLRFVINSSIHHEKN